MDSAWYERGRTLMADEYEAGIDSEAIHQHDKAMARRDAARQQHGPHPRAPSSVPPHSSHHAAHNTSRTLPQVRISWQGLIASTNLCIDLFTSNISNQYRSSGDLHLAADLLFFLTHMHADHTSGLTPSWNAGVIYTSHVSKPMVHAKFGIEEERIIPLALHTTHCLPLNRAGTELMYCTLIDASTHCPGAVMYLFDGYFGRILYTGDIRFDRRCEANLRAVAKRYENMKAQAVKRGPMKWNSHKENEKSAKVNSGLAWLLEDEEKKQKDDQIDRDMSETPPRELSDGDEDLPLDTGLFGTIDALYLDNTFCHPRYSHFHTTTSVLPAIHAVIQAHPACDILLGGDSLGKEDLLVLLSHMCESRIVVPESRWKMLQTMARVGVELNTEVDEQQIRKITRHVDAICATTTDVTAPSSIADTATPAATFLNPLNSSRDWLSCFSPRPHDGFIKLGPKKQVTAPNVEWMNRMVRIREQREEKQRKKDERFRRKRRKMAQRAEEALEPQPNSSSSADKKNTDEVSSNISQHSIIDVDKEAVDENQQSDHSTSDDDEDDEEEDSAAFDSTVDASLDRPVVGIIVSGWAADRIPALAANTAAAVSAPPALSHDVTSHCQGPGAGNCKIHCLPYSSHSSYTEIRRFVSLVRPNIIRPLCKGDCNTAVLDDLLNTRADLKPIVIPTSMTRATLKPIDGTIMSEANKERMIQQTRALKQSVQQSSTNFSALANSICSSASSNKMIQPPGASITRAAMPIGRYDSDEIMHPGTLAANGAHVDLTTSLASSLPVSLEVDEATLKPEPTQQPSVDADCLVVSSKLAPVPLVSLPRVSSWLHLFEVFEHYPNVPIEGMVIPPPSELHLQSYEYTRNVQSDAKLITQQSKPLSTTIRKLPRFLQPQSQPIEIDADAQPDSSATLSSSSWLASTLAPLPAPSTSSPSPVDSKIVIPASFTILSSSTSSSPPSPLPDIKSASPPPQQYVPSLSILPPSTTSVGDAPTNISLTSPVSHKRKSRHSTTDLTSSSPLRSVVKSAESTKPIVTATTAARKSQKAAVSRSLPSYMTDSVMTLQSKAQLNKAEAKPTQSTSKPTTTTTKRPATSSKPATINRQHSVLEIDCTQQQAIIDVSSSQSQG